ncbi:MAG: 4-carboxymuconolactone decarboxylase [Rhodospirillaceae bacterium]|nr:4-carboxymuconolactone decarboxylase [Rhodospirillaceae bacterium]MBT5457476.1 4-carboxymuconolactone decarboxylase [Rhodospirillaceae bacterium]
MSNQDTYDKGLNIRREVLGSQYVDPNIAKSKENDFDGAIQDVVTEYCWGMGWGREGVLDRKTRSMLVLAMLTALGKPNELKAHTRGALRNGVTVEEIRELLIHATVYCGIPAGVDAFRNAKEAIDAYEADQK